MNNIDQVVCQAQTLISNFLKFPASIPRHGIYAMGLKEDSMELLNFDEAGRDPKRLPDLAIRQEQAGQSGKEQAEASGRSR